MKGMRYESAEVGNVQKFIDDPAWSMEQKADGIRCIVRVAADGTVALLTHTGEPLKSHQRYHAALRAAFQEVGQTGLTVDGELLEDGHLWLFDVMEVLGTDTRLLPQGQRRALLDQLHPAFGGTGCVSVLSQAVTAADKLALWESVVAESAEGVVVKRRSAPYSTGKARTKDVLKVKITRTIDVVVMARNLDGHENAALGLYRDGVLTPVGRCSMLGKANAQPGDVIEVTSLGMYGDNETLCQTRMMRARPDKAAVDCQWDQVQGIQINRAVLSDVS